MGLLSRSELPEHLDEAKEWKGTDDDVWYMRWRLYVKHWFSFGCTPERVKQGFDLGIIFIPGLYVLPFTIWFTGWSWWYLFPVCLCPMLKRWRRYPITLFGIRGRGAWRCETDGKEDTLWDRKFVFFKNFETGYLSRVQYWCRWHFKIDWPFMVGFHLYWKDEDVLKARERNNVDGKYFGGYRGFHRDADILYWGDGAALGNPK